MTRKITPIALGLLAFCTLALAGCGTLPMTNASPPAPVTATGQ